MKELLESLAQSPRPWILENDPAPGGKARILDGAGEPIAEMEIESEEDLALLLFMIAAVNGDRRSADAGVSFTIHEPDGDILVQPVGGA